MSSIYELPVSVGISPLETLSPETIEDTTPVLAVVGGIDSELSPSRALYDSYVAQREAVQTLPKIEGQELTSIQSSVAQWLEGHPEFTRGQDYGTFDKTYMDKKLGGLVDYLRTNHPEINELELTATESFVSSSFAMFEDRSHDGTVSEDADGSFAFVVPARMSRKDPDYGQEVEPVIPALRYVPNELRAQMMVGLPPFVIDTYDADQWGKRGYLIFAPIYSDMMDDLQGMDIFTIPRDNVNTAIDFAQERFGVEGVGLGATIPGIMKLGQSVTNPNVFVTNGHAGTADMVRRETLEAIRLGYVANTVDPRVGVVGNGLIGRAIGHLLAREFSPPVYLFDNEVGRSEKTKGSIESEGGEAEIVTSADELFRKSDIIVSAITGRIALSGIEGLSLEGKMVLDDSQPGSIDPDEVIALGGSFAWIIGNGQAHRRNYDYGTMVDPHRDAFGCELEVATIKLHADTLRSEGVPEDEVRAEVQRLAVRDRVTPEKAYAMGELFDRYGVKPAPFQSHGQLLASRL